MGADRRVVEAIFIAKALGGEPVDVGSLSVGAAVAADPGDTVILAGNPENIGAFFGEKRVNLE